MKTGQRLNRIQLVPAALLLALVTLVIYLPVLRCDFVNFDDQVYVTDNSHVKAGLSWAGFRWAFTTFHGSNWHPLTWLSHMLDCELFGLNPAAHHFGNIVLHSVNAALLLVLLVRITGLFWPGLMVAALFAWHPLHVESVAWISERKDVLSTFFALLTLLSYVAFVRTGSRIRYGLALLCFALGLLAKPMLVTLPCVMLLLDFWPLRRFSPSASPPGSRWWQLLIEKILFFLLTILSCAVTRIAQQQAVMTLQQYSFELRFENTVISYARYLLNMIWPVDLAIMYPLPDHWHWIHVAFTVSIPVLLFLSWFAWRERNHRPYLLMGWLWYLGTLVPVIGLVKVGSVALADRYTYFPLIGIFIAITFSAHELGVRLPALKKIFVPLGVLVLAACVALTENQLQFWRTSKTLFCHDLAVAPDNASARINLGAALETSGHQTEALAEYQQAVRLADDNADAHIDLANLLLAMGRKTEAQPEYHKAIALAPDRASYHYDFGFALVHLEQFAAATKELALAARLDPQNPWPHFEIATALLKTGHDAEAIDALRAALRIDPDNYEILAFTAHVLAADENAAVRNGQAAVTLAFKACLLTGSSQPMFLDVLGMACAEAGRFTDARDATQKALDLATAAQMKNLEPLRERLELYKNNQPWRESFRATNAPAQMH